MKYILLITLLLLNNLFATEKLKIVFPKEFLPSYVLKNSKTTGYGIELFKEIEKDLNLNVEYIQKENWPSVMKDMKIGLVDIVPNQGITEERKKYMRFSVPIEHTKISIFQKSNQGFYVKSINDILEKSVAVVQSNVCVKIFTKYENIKTIIYNNKNEAFEAFKNGKTDLLCYPEKPVKEYIRENSLKQEIEKSFEIMNINRAIAVHKKHGYLIDDINKSLEKLRKNGKLEKIYKKWHKVEKQYSIVDIIKILVVLSVIPLFMAFYLNYKKVILTRKELEDEVKRKTELLRKSEEEKRKQENLILHQSKMASMGEMLENIAHQWRQPLSMISTSATGVELQKELNILKDDYLIESMKNINEATQYLSSTIDDFRNYFSPNKSSEEINLQRTVEKVKRLLSSKFKNSVIEIKTNCEEIKVINLENELLQVLINVLNNAKDAFLNKEIDKKLIIIDSYKEDEDFVIKIKDNAGGIKENIIEKIFDPYFTTKHQSKGTGLGLFMCVEILNKHMNGDISVENVEFEYEAKKYKGAQFTIRLKNL